MKIRSCKLINVDDDQKSGVNTQNSRASASKLQKLFETRHVCGSVEKTQQMQTSEHAQQINGNAWANKFGGRLGPIVTDVEINVGNKHQSLNIGN